MKTIKAIGLLFAVCFAVLAFCRTALAVEYYTVKKGDCLSRIAKKYGVSVKELHNANKDKITNINLIYPNQIFVIPDEYTEFSFENPGEEKYKGTLEEALNLHKYPEMVQESLKEKVRKDNYEWVEIENGDKFAMVFRKNKVRYNVIANLKKSLKAKKYTATVEGIEYALLYPPACGNWVRPPELIPILEEPPRKEEVPKEPSCELVIDPEVIEKGQPATLEWKTTDTTYQIIEPDIGEVGVEGKVEITPYDSTLYTLVAKGPGGDVECKASITVTPEEVIITLFEEPEKEKVEERCDLMEFTPGVGYVKSFKSHTDDWFGFVDHVKWLNRNCSLPDNYGVGFYGIGDAGHGRNDVYWSKIAPGAQFATWKQLDKQNALLAKLRLNYAIKNVHFGGEDHRSYNLMPGVYSEIVRSLSATDKLILALDANYLPDDSYGSLKLYWEHRVSQDWKLKPGIGPIFIGSAGDAFGANISFTARYRNRLNFGPSLTLIKGGPFYGGLVYYETGPDIRVWYLNHERDKVKKINKEGGEKEITLQSEEKSSVEIESLLTFLSNLSKEKEE